MGVTLSVKNISSVIKDMTKEISSIRWRGKNINVRRLISYREEADLIRSIISCATSDDGEYIIPELLSLSTMSNIVSCYSSVELPDDIEELHNVMYGTNLYECVTNEISKTQLNTILDAIKYYTEC